MSCLRQALAVGSRPFSTPAEIRWLGCGGCWLGCIIAALVVLFTLAQPTEHFWHGSLSEGIPAERAATIELLQIRPAHPEVREAGIAVVLSRALTTSRLLKRDCGWTCHCRSATPTSHLAGTSTVRPSMVTPPCPSPTSHIRQQPCEYNRDCFHASISA